MNFEANIETADSVKEKVKAAFGFDLRSALDLVKRSDYDTDEQYLDACARAEWNAAALNTEQPEAALKPNTMHGERNRSARHRAKTIKQSAAT